MGATTDVFAHAGVRLDGDAAAACIAELMALLRPYVDPGSIWGDRRSWALLSEEEK